VTIVTDQCPNAGSRGRTHAVRADHIAVVSSHGRIYGDVRRTEWCFL